MEKDEEIPWDGRIIKRKAQPTPDGRDAGLRFRETAIGVGCMYKVELLRARPTITPYHLLYTEKK